MGSKLCCTVQSPGDLKKEKGKCLTPTSTVQHSLETIGGSSYISFRALKNPQSSHPFCLPSGGYTLKVRGPSGLGRRASIPLRPRPVCPARGSGAPRGLGGGSAMSFSGRNVAEPKVAGGGRRGEEGEGGRRGREAR